ncbi:gag-pol polyprotein [Tanacetum coccineum]
MNGPYVRRMIPEPGDADREVPVPETLHEQTDDELTVAEIKQMEADDQAIQTILLGLPEDIYAAVDKKKAKVVNEWGKRNKHFPEKIASNLKFLNNLQPEWSRHVTIVHQTKDLHTTDYTQLYDFLKYNQKEVDDQRAERLAKTHDPLALMANSNNPFTISNYMQQPMPNPEDITDPTTAMNMALALMAKAFKLNYSTPTNNNQRISSNPRNRQIAQPGMNMGQDRQMRMVGANGGNQFRQYAGQNGVQNIGNGNVVAARAEGNAPGNNGNQIRCYNCRGLGHLARNCTVRPRRRGCCLFSSRLNCWILSKEGKQESTPSGRVCFGWLLPEILMKLRKSCKLHLWMANFAASIDIGTQTGQTPVYDSDGSVSSGKQITTLNEEISKLSKQLSTEKSTVSSLLEEKKKLKSDFKIREDETS